MNGRRLINRFARAVTTYERQATVQRHAAECLTELLGRHLHTLAPRIFEIGCGTGLLTRLLASRFAPSEILLNDICPDMGICFANVPRTRFSAGDATEIDFPSGVDVIATASAVQWFGDLKRFADRCAEALPPGGLLALTSFGPDNLREIASLTGVGLEYVPYADFVRILGNRFEPLEAERESVSLRFADASAVLRHLKETGVTATNADRTPWTRARIADLELRYARLFPAPEGGVTLTYEPYYFVGRRRR